jgi:hypothetical protein
VAGQLLILSTLNQVARFARRVSLVGPDSSLVVPTLLAAATFRGALMETARAIDPFISFIDDRSAESIAIGFGRDAPAGADLYVGGEGWDAVVSRDMADIPNVDESSAGVALASCIAAAHGFCASLDINAEMFFGTFSGWSMARGHVEAPPFPTSTDLGSVLIAGAGAVTSAFAYWAKLLGIRGCWDVVDRDVVDLPNTNRGLLFTAAHAGLDENTPAAKVDVVASWLDGATPHPYWLDEYLERDGASRRWDLYLPLANDRGARALMQLQYPPLMLHATTGEHWDIFRHRHRALVDGCIACRFPGDLPVMGCSTSTVTTKTDKTHDAALPFMSAAAGLLLALDCVRLTLGELEAESFLMMNWLRDLATSRGEWPCSSDCRYWEPRTIHRALNHETKWFV